MLIFISPFYYPYYKNKKSKPKFGIDYAVKRENKLDHLKDGFKVLAYNRLIGGIIIGFFLIISSIVYLVLGIIEYF